MGMTDKKTALIHGGNGGKLVPEPATVPDELERARDIARRYRCEFIDLRDFLLLGKRIVTKVSTLKQISDILQKTEQSKRVLEDASEGFTLDVIREDEAGN